MGRGAGGGGRGSGGFGTNKSDNVKLAVSKAEKLGMDVTTSSITKIPKDEVAIYNNATGEVFINTRADYWNDPARYANENYENGWLSSSNPMHPIYHEQGHALFNPSPNWNGGKDIAAKVSKYATVNPREFVSEVYAGLKAGKKYPADVMRFYNQYAKNR